ncbi:MAG: MgtC/SapB family protein [Anaerolineae bacterium]|nr:MgtC/SapB family protein [Anaerolineae bacterium]MBT3714024.1 MgtC/SapB family protein [Anaerolineae bacterium]MBT4312474.1 MgtC/SapB family protein [Anaerolineae bacterium]MBT4458732.1 MgtC/SapB family protein [Anaerolineae bacterium]MBT4842258.1 MgtC/SapB family protein [Anaerolineae bacterium]
MENADLFLRFGVALAIGFLIGLQREFAHGGSERNIIAGERTFALFGLAGALAAMAADELDSALAFVGIILVLGAFITAAYLVDARKGQMGLTTEVAIVVAITAGALAYWGYLTLALAVGIATTVLLSLKLETDRFARSLMREDLSAALQLAVISAIILPVLPNESFLPPPFDVLNPFKIWLMVVFISGISFLGYVAIKVIGPEQGIGITGFLGGLVSSTAVTLSFSERSKREPELSKPFALAITVAWTVMFARVLVEVGVVYQPLLKLVWIPVTASGLVGLAYCLYLFFSQRTAEKADVEFSNPFDLGSAIKFGLLYGLVLLISRAAQMYLGDTGLYLSSIISGVADVDAITLSMAELSKTGVIEMPKAALAIILATMSNTAVKGGIALAMGGKALRKPLLFAILMMLAVGIGTALLI